MFFMICQFKEHDILQLVDIVSTEEEAKKRINSVKDKQLYYAKYFY